VALPLYAGITYAPVTAVPAGHATPFGWVDVFHLAKPTLISNIEPVFSRLIAR